VTVFDAQGDPLVDPLVIWLNGGPGCSSFDGWVYEHGPFTFKHDKAGRGQPAHLNPYSWSKSATMLYVDSPAGFVRGLPLMLR
jgi:serine carboxypeptidase-like clade 1